MKLWQKGFNRFRDQDTEPEYPYIDSILKHGEL